MYIKDLLSNITIMTSIFEKHFTLDRAKKGTDHSFSLEPMGLTRFVRNLHRIKKMIGSNEKKLLNSEVAPLFKMKKSIVAKKSMQAGKILEYSEFRHNHSLI